MIFGVFLIIIGLLLIYVGYQLRHAPDMPEDEAESREQQERKDFTDV